MAHRKTCLPIFALVVAAVYGQPAVPNLTCNHPNPATCQLDNINVFSNTPQYSVSGYNLPGITTLTITSNKLAIISPVFCMTLPSLVSIKANDVGIEQLDQSAFDFCFNLGSLDLRSNQIQVLPPTVFHGATALTSLILGSNKILGVADGQFETNLRLTVLDLHDNFIGNFPFSAIKNCKSLRQIRLDTNNLAKLDVPSILENSQALSELYLNDNLFACSTLQQVVQSFGLSPQISNYVGPYNRFRLYKMSNISTYTCVEDVCPTPPPTQAPGPDLPCNHTRIGNNIGYPFNEVCLLKGINVSVDIPNYTISDYNLSIITYLYIYDGVSKLGTFTPAFCESLPALYQIQANNVGIEVLDQRAFDSCANLQVAVMVGNLFQVLPSFQGPKNLQTLQLRSNRILRVADNQFEANTILKTLWLDDNQLVDFPPSAVKNCPSLKNIRLNNNNLTRLDYGTLLKNSPNLVDWTVNGNLFPCSTLQADIQTYSSTNIFKDQFYYKDRVRPYQMSTVSNFTCVVDV